MCVANLMPHIPRSDLILLEASRASMRFRCNHMEKPLSSFSLALPLFFASTRSASAHNTCSPHASSTFLPAHAYLAFLSAKEMTTVQRSRYVA